MLVTYNPFRNYDQWLQSNNPMEQDFWDELYCAFIKCKKPYPQDLIEHLENGEDPGASWPFCSSECEQAYSDNEKQANNVESKAWLEIEAWEHATGQR